MAERRRYAIPLATTTLRSALVACICCGWLLSCTTNAAEKEAAYIKVKVAVSRSGPGMEHYATNALALGDMVEIVERQNGWAAIRPTMEAYSWIAADKLRVINENEAEITADQAKAWLGSDFEEVAKHVSQVQLRRGERVQILGEKEVPASAGSSEKWLKIRPPVGERRWVRESELSDSPPLHSAKTHVKESGLPPNEDGWTTRGHSKSLGVLADAIPEERARHNSSRSSFINARERLDNYEDEVARLQLALSRAATEIKSSKEVADLQNEIEDLLDTGRSTLERGQASRLLESAVELKKLAEQREDLGLADGEKNSSDAAESEADKLAHFQVKGWLMPVAWFGRPTELCAIMDDEHKFVSLVSPAPGVNLRRYLNKEVGIVGEESFKVQGRRHIIVHRVVELSRHRDAKPESFAKAPWVRFRPKQNTATIADLMADDLKAPDVQVQ